MPVFAAVLMAVCAVAGALMAWPVPIVLGVAACTASLVGRSSTALVLSAGMLTSALSADAWAELDEPLPSQVAGAGKLARDPERVNGAVRADIEVGGRRYQAWARNDHAQTMFELSTGQGVIVTGSTQSLTGKASPSSRRRHVAGRLNIEHLQAVGKQPALQVVADRWRDTVSVGANALDDEDHALLMGLVFGDDREQSEQQQEAFRASGLSHLLAVSGQNVAFLLLLLQPVVRRFSLPVRVAMSAAALVVFGTATRWEPSVVRAVIMAAVVLAATLLGRKIHPWRTLALAVTAAVLVDPFLAGSIGFLLSVSACCGMALLGQPIARRLPGPAALRVALAFTMAAQIGVAPVQLAVFGNMPVVALVTNLLAGPLAAFTMMWGMTVGLLAGVAGGWFAVVFHWPTAFSVSGLDLIASVGSEVKLAWNAALAGALAAVLLLAPVRHVDSGVDELMGTGREADR